MNARAACRLWPLVVIIDDGDEERASGSPTASLIRCVRRRSAFSCRQLSPHARASRSEWMKVGCKRLETDDTQRNLRYAPAAAGFRLASFRVCCQHCDASALALTHPRERARRRFVARESARATRRAERGGGHRRHCARWLPWPTSRDRRRSLSSRRLCRRQQAQRVAASHRRLFLFSPRLVVVVLVGVVCRLNSAANFGSRVRPHLS